MRAICNVCQHKDTCSYLKRGRESDCIDVQTSDYGYEEAVEKAKDFLKQHAKAFGCADGLDAVYIYDTELLIKHFIKAMDQ